MKTLQRLMLCGALVLAALAAQAEEKPAATMLASAGAQAKASKKQVMVIFHASWCGWCKKLDAFMADASMKKLIDDNFVVVHLDVMESPEKKSLENPGGDVVMENFKGKNAGLPFIVVTDPAGKMLINSNMQKDGTAMNTGYPAKPEEIAWFMKMLKTAPRLSAVQAKSIETWLTANAPK